jgi:hypothetical protein
MHNVYYLCRQLEGVTLVLDTILWSFMSGTSSNISIWVLRVDPPTLLIVNANRSGIPLASILTLMIQYCATNLLSELSECNDRLTQSHAQLQL